MLFSGSLFRKNPHTTLTQFQNLQQNIFAINLERKEIKQVVVVCLHLNNFHIITINMPMH